MTTPPTPPTGPTPDDDRDPRVAARLAVEPLDDLTRARLVRAALAASDPTALDADDGGPTAVAAATPPGRRRSPSAVLVSVAAAVLVLLVVVGAVLRPAKDGSTPSATPSAKVAPAPASRDSDAGATPPAAAAEGAQIAAGPVPLPSLGDLGDVSTKPLLAAAVRDALPAGPGTDDTTDTDEISGCAAAASLALGTPVAAGTGTMGGRPAVVVVVTQADGSTAVVAVRGRSCGKTVSAVLP